MHIAIFLEELSRVFFKKSNLRNKETWWLSMFYSLCIQSIVRRALMALTDSAQNEMSDSVVQAKQYLYLPLRLFIASSGPFDPLNRPPTNEMNGVLDDYERAAKAVNQSSWSSNGIQSSGDYLRSLFEDDCRALSTGNIEKPSHPYGLGIPLNNMSSSHGSYPRDSSMSDNSNMGSDTESSFSPAVPRSQASLGSIMPHVPQPVRESYSSNNEKKQKCKVCDKRFLRLTSLQTHMYSHTGEKRKSSPLISRLETVLTRTSIRL